MTEFIANRGSKAVDKAIQLAKKFAEAEACLNLARKSHIELLEEELTDECIEGCESKWLIAPKHLLQRHNFKEGFCNALEKGTGKYRNFHTHGPANCRKSFYCITTKSDLQGLLESRYRFIWLDR